MREASRAGLRGQGGAHVLEEAGQPLDMHVAQEVGQRARQGEAVLHRVAHAGGSLGAVAQDPPAPVGGAAEIGGID